MRTLTSLIVVVVLAVSLGARPASAQQVPGASDPPPEGGLVGQQLAVGALAGIFAGFGAAVLTFTDTRAGYEAAGGLMATAVLPGLAVCALGTSSRFYQGSCAASIAGAYMGVLATGLLATRFRVSTESDGFPIRFLLVWGVSTLGTSAAAVVGWHATKQRRPAPPAVAVEPPVSGRALWPEMPVRQLASAPGTVSVPLLAFAF